MDVMMTTCRCCGRELAFPEEALLWNCAACGTMNARPQAEGPTLSVLRRATQQRLRCDFHNAETSYQHVLLDYPDEHEALWGLALCRYGVEYVDDPVTGKRMPTVHTVRKRPMQADSDFQQACELAPEEVRAQYEAEAEYIDDAMSRICELAQSCPPYDVFICHKTTKPGSEEYTEDYNRAFKLYHMLDKQGYRAFFAPMEMEDVSAGSDYEAAIYHALDTAKVMLVVCSEAEYLQSPWVRSEYLRFLEMAEDSEGKCLLPLLYGSMGAGKLPRDFRRLQAITMGEMGSAEKVSETVRRYAGAAQQDAVREVLTAPQPAPVQPEPVPVPPPAPQPKPEDDYETASCEGGCMIAKYTGAGGDVTIPSVLRGQKVVAIGKEAFSNCDVLTGIVIPEGVHTIGDFAFYGCYGLKTVILPKSLQSIGFVVFGNCWAITSFTVAAGNEHYRIENDMLINKDGVLLHALRKPGQTVQRVPEGVIDIGPYTFFASVGLTRVILPESLLGIGLSAFGGGRDLEELTLPRGIVRIDETAFLECPKLKLRVHAGTNAHAFVKEKGLQHEVIPEVTPVMRAEPVGADGGSYTSERDFVIEDADGGVCITKYNGEDVVVLIPPIIGGRRVLRIGEHAFARMWINKVVIPTGVTSIGGGAFAECSGLTSVTIPVGVTSIGQYAFRDCDSLTSVDIPDSVISIGRSAFSGCSGLTSITLPESVTSIGEWAFHGCSGLTSINIPRGVENIGEWTFRECSSLTSMIIPEGVTSIGDWAFADCAGLASISIPEGVTSLGNGAFAGCTSLTRINIPNSVTSIGSSAFSSCCFTNVNIPTGVTSISDNMFSHCSITSITIPEGVTSIGNRAFSYCKELTSIIIPEGVTSIGDSVFEDCEKLTSITLPRSVTSIGDAVFRTCRNLTLQVVRDSYAHKFAQTNRLSFRIGGAEQSQPSLFSRLFGKK